MEDVGDVNRRLGCARRDEGVSGDADWDKIEG